MRTLLLLSILLADPTWGQELLRELVSPHAEPDGEFGSALAAVPDIDGDGRSDILVGAPWENAGATNAGRAYVYSGANWTLRFELMSPRMEMGGHFATSVAAVDDVDGDGLADLLVGAPGESAGRAYVFSGADGALLLELASPDPRSGGNFGASVAGLPDLDGDTRGDLAVGATDEGPLGEGAVHVFSGASGGRLRTIEPPRFLGGEYGAAIAAVPDADGDGVADLIVGAPYAHSEGNGGAAFFYSGATGAFIRSHIGTTATTREDEFGRSVAGVEDLNGDGQGDYVVGAPYDGEDGTPSSSDYSGRVRIYSGANGTLIHHLASPNIERNGYYGYAVAGVPDVDGDGRSDVLVGAPGETPASGSPWIEGRAYVFSGVTGTLLRVVAPPGLSPGYGPFGAAVAAVPDVDGKEQPGFLVGATSLLTQYWSSSSSTGLAYLYAAEGGAAPDVVAEPVEPPVVIPPEGGTLAFTLTLTSQNANPLPQLWMVWGMAAREGEPEVGPFLGPSRVTLGAGETVTEMREHEIPGTLPSGLYTCSVYVGHYPFIEGGGPMFTFTKVRTTASEPGAGDPTAYALHPARPNPLASRATVPFDLPEPSPVRIVVYDALGREVAVLVDRLMVAGRHEVVFDASALRSGAYLARLEASGHVVTQRLAVVR